MAKRILAATFVILAAGALIAPEVLAGGRGPSGGHMTPPRGLHAPVGKTVAHARSLLGLHHAARHDRRRDLGLPLTGWWGNGGYGGYYDPSNYTMLHDRPAQTEPFLSTVPTYPPVYSGGPYPAPFAAPVQKPVDVIVYRPGCSAETETLPWSNGKARTITMVRC